VRRAFRLRTSTCVLTRGPAPRQPAARPPRSASFVAAEPGEEPAAAALSAESMVRALPAVGVGRPQLQELATR
jgi:hypothetical protein